MNYSYGDDAPIAAFASLPGNSAFTLIRCSGLKCIDLLSSIFHKPEKLRNAHGNTIVHGWICLSDEKIDEVLVSVFHAPKSYTGEDSAEISCHGGISAGSAVMRALKTAGFREALPGEFSFRAFMNGKLDLTRSESVMELVSAKTETARKHAIVRLQGSLENEINRIKKSLTSVLAGAELFLDYSDDEVSADDNEKTGILPGKNKAYSVLKELRNLAAAWDRERIFQEGISVLIIGMPNTGKSSLFNTLLKEDRAIVTEIPGTTRDWLEAWITIQGIPVRLIDTAGLREAADEVEALGIQRTKELIQSADIILYLIDGNTGICTKDKELIAMLNNSTDSAALILLWNKADLAPKPQNLQESIMLADMLTANNSMLAVSAKTGQGINELCNAIAAAINAMHKNANETCDLKSAGLGSARQKSLVDQACSSLEQALTLADKFEPLDLIAPLLRDAVNALGEITGEVSTADILEEIFSRFCVGK